MPQKIPNNDILDPIIQPHKDYTYSRKLAKLFTMGYSNDILPILCKVMEMCPDKDFAASLFVNIATKTD